MYQIDLRRVRMVKAGLSAQEAVLDGVAEDLREIGALLGEMSFDEGVHVVLAEIREEICENRASLHQMAACLEAVDATCRNAERKVADRYDLEDIAYPKTAFGTSRITGLDKYESLLVFSGGKRRS